MKCCHLNTTISGERTTWNAVWRVVPSQIMEAYSCQCMSSVSCWRETPCLPGCPPQWVVGWDHVLMEELCFVLPHPTPTEMPQAPFTFSTSATAALCWINSTRYKQRISEGDGGCKSKRVGEGDMALKVWEWYDRSKEGKKGKNQMDKIIE